MFKILKYFLLALPALLGALILTLAKTMPFMAENVFAASFFPVVSGALTWFSGLFPFFADGIRALCTCSDIARGRCSSHSSETAAVPLSASGFVRLLRRISALCDNARRELYRPTVQEFMKLDDPSDSVEELYNACVEEAKGGKRTPRNAFRGRKRTFQTFKRRFGNAERHRQRIQKRNSEVADFSEKRSVKGKRSAYLPALVVHGHYGNVFSDAWEANVNTNVSQSDLPFTAAHELAHTKGIAREDECNFIAYLACISSDNAEYRYSGHLSAYTYLANALYARSPELFAKAAQNISPAAERDLAEQREYSAKYTSGKPRRSRTK